MRWAALFFGCGAIWAQTSHPPAIASISVCSPTGAGGSGSCPSGTSDTHQIVLAPDGSGNAINSYSGMIGISDEHQSVFAPGALKTNNDYLFFVASRVAGGAASTGVVVLSGGAGPAKNGQWTFNLPTTDGYGSYASGFGTLFVAPTGPNCPTVADGSPAQQDTTFDLSYAAPGSVVVDPTAAAGALLMVYEGTNTCFGIADSTTKNNQANFYSSVGMATSLDYGHTWPTYRGKAGFTFAPLPGQNSTQGPAETTGATDTSVCVGNDCLLTQTVSYGRYAVLSPSVSLTTAMALGTAIPSSMGDSEMSAFVDDAGTGPAQYLYIAYNGKAGTGALADPKEPGNGLMIARAQLNGGMAPLGFLKWNGNAFAAAGMGGYDTPIFPNGAFANCEAPAQLSYGASISYVDATQQYLLTFVCDSPGDPALGQIAGSARGAAWFYSTSYNLPDPTQWSPPQEVAGTWAPFDLSGGCSDYKGFYPTWMSLAAKSGHLGTSGHVFYLWGCQTDNTPPGRQYSSRAFTITTTATPALTTGTLANGATYSVGGLVPGSWAQVKGTGLSNVTRTWAASDFTGLGNNLPTNLSGVQVAVNNLPAAVYYIDPGQVSFQVPSGVSGTASVQVINNGVATNTLTASAATSAPGIFPVIVNGTNYAAGVFFSDGLYVGDASIGPAFRNAKPGDIIELFATGLVPTPAGVLPTSQTVSGVTVTIGNVTIPASFAGLVAVGEFQINFTVPQQFSNLPAGAYPITITVNGVSSPATVNTVPPGQIVIPIQPR